MAVDKENERNMRILKERAFNVKFDLADTDYKRLENIGIGAYGVVCSALNKRTVQKVAIKKIPNIFDVHTTALRTYREIKILKHFKHDNVIAIREILKPKDYMGSFRDVYVVLDLMESDLHRIIYSHQEISDEHVRYFLYQILRALKYIHSANVIHRDLKPSNVLVNEDCLLKIGDFGMARGVFSSPDQHNPFMTQYVATRWYRAPEIMMSHLRYSVSVDIWSVGCILAEMIGRKVLFPGKDFLNQLRLICSTLGTPTPAYLAAIQSDMIRTVVQRMGTKEGTPWNKLYPVSNRKALDLLSKLVTLNPQDRLSADEALRHPYLSKYHDPDDEPTCIPAFNFDFEKEGLHSDVLREAIITEIMEYHDKGKKTTTGIMLAKSLAANDSTINQHLEPSVSSVPLYNSPEYGKIPVTTMLDGNTVTENNQMPFNIPVENNYLPTENNSGIFYIAPENNSITESPSLTVETSDKSVSVDVDMPTAESTREKKIEHEIKEEARQEYKTISSDTKALIKAAVLQSQKQRTEESGRDGKGKPVTALQRQREREERRLKKKERAREKVKKAREDTLDKNVGLSQADKDLLARWQTMQASRTNATNDLSNQNSNAVGPETGAFDNLKHILDYPTLGFAGALRENKPNILPLFDVSKLTELNSADCNQFLNQSEDGVAARPVQRPPQSYDTSAADDTILHRLQTQDTAAYRNLDPIRASYQKLRAETDAFILNPLAHDLRVNVEDELNSDLITYLSQQLSKSQVEDMLPPCLADTPKGTGGGYGVGLDLDALVCDVVLSHPPTQQDDEKPDSTPVSASLLADWMDVTGSMSASELEALIKDSEMTSPINFSDFNSPVEPPPDYD